MKYKKIILLTIILVSLFAISAVSAADNATSDIVTVEESTLDALSVDEAKEVVSVEGNDGFDDLMSDVNDNVLGKSIYVNGSTFTAIENAIDSAVDGDIIYLNSPYYEGSGSHITIKKDITIIGKHSTLDAKYLSRIVFSNNKVTLINITFINGYNNDGDGGAVYIKDSGSFVNCNFVNNSDIRRGGAVYIGSSSSGSFVSCNFVNNSAKREEGGAVFSFGPSSFSDCSFVNNSAKQGKGGGAVYINSAFSTAYGSFVDCSFVNNSGGSYGGAVYIWSSSSSNFVDCSFVNNSAGSYGGAVYIVGSGQGSFVSCNFVNNSAKWDQGGAVYVSISGSFVDCSFVNNYAGVGSGAVYTDGSCNFENCSFVNNYGHHGAVSTHGEFNSFVNCSFVNNSAEYDNGGSVYISDDDSGYPGSCNFENCCFADNSVYKGNGGAVYIEYSCSSSFVNCSFVNNSVELGEGGAVYIKGSGTGNFVKCTFMDNMADSTRNDIVGDATTEDCIFGRYDLIVSDVDKFYGDGKEFVVGLVDGDGIPIENANINITLNNKKSTVKTNSKGQASVDLNLDVGNYEVISEYESVSATSKVTVKSTIATSDATGTYLNSKVTATFLNTDGKALASKQMSFKINGKSYAATTNSKGVATADVDLGSGTYTVTAINPVNNEQKQFKLVIDKASSAIALASSQINGVTTLTATLTPAAATGNVVFNVNGEEKSAAIKNGKATLTLSDLNPGDYNVTASYSGDKNLNASTSNTVTFNVPEVYPILTADPVTKTYGTSTKLAVNLADSKGNAIADADVSVVIGSATTHIKTDSNGQATMAINKAPGTYTATITYADAQTTAKITVKKATPKLTAKAKTFKKSVKTKKYTVTLKTNQNKVMKNTKVTIKVNKKTYSAKTNSKGQATFKITKLTKKGKYTATIKYAGSKYYNAKTVKAKITVK